MAYYLLASLIALLVLTYHMNKILRRSLSNMKHIVYMITIIPGTVLHELSHVFFILIFGMKVIRCELWSGKFTGEYGNVDFTYHKHNLIHRAGLFLIGLSPMIVLVVYGYLMINLIGFVIEPDNTPLLTFHYTIDESFTWRVSFLFISSIFILPHSIPSPADLRIALKGLFPGIALLMAVYIVFEITSNIRLFEIYTFHVLVVTNIVLVITLIYQTILISILKVITSCNA